MTPFLCPFSNFLSCSGLPCPLEGHCGSHASVIVVLIKTSWFHWQRLSTFHMCRIGDSGERISLRKGISMHIA